MATKRLTSAEREFIAQELARAKKLGVRVRLIRARTIDTDGYHTLGHFDEEGPSLVCAAKRPDWVSVFAHESCHMDQWAEQSYFWRRSLVAGVDVGNIVWLWTQKKIELTLEQLRDYTARIRDIEWDCEKRTVAKIREFGLSEDVATYTQQANAYLYSITLKANYRMWHFRGRISVDNKLHSTCPTKFLRRHAYNDVPEAFRQAFIAKFGQPRL